MLHHLVLVYTFNNIAEFLTVVFFPFILNCTGALKSNIFTFEITVFGENAFLVYS